MKVYRVLRACLTLVLIGLILSQSDITDTANNATPASKDTQAESTTSSSNQGTDTITASSIQGETTTTTSSRSQTSYTTLTSENSTASEKSSSSSDSTSASSSQTVAPVVQGLNNDQRAEYYYWVKFKNSFTFDANQKAKLARAFTPEDPSYEKRSQNITWFMYLFAGLFGLSFLVYLVGRFILNRFKGPKTHISPWYGRMAFVFVFIGFVCCITFYSISLKGSIQA